MRIQGRLQGERTGKQRGQKWACGKVKGRTKAGVTKTTLSRTVGQSRELEGHVWLHIVLAHVINAGLGLRILLLLLPDAGGPGMYCHT